MYKVLGPVDKLNTRRATGGLQTLCDGTFPATQTGIADMRNTRYQNSANIDTQSDRAGSARDDHVISNSIFKRHHSSLSQSSVFSSQSQYFLVSLPQSELSIFPQSELSIFNRYRQKTGFRTYEISVCSFCEGPASSSLLGQVNFKPLFNSCLLYTSDAADE